MKICTSRYFSQDWFAQENEEIWRKNWIPVGHVSEFKSVGDLRHFNMVGTGVIVLLGEDGFSAFVNSCPHRGAELVERTCTNLEKFRCPLHGWEFSLEGEIQHQPAPMIEFLGLKRLYCTEAFGFVWVSSKNTDIKDYFKDVATWLQGYRLEELKCTAIYETTIQANWKIATDLTNEVYHYQELHPEMLGVLNDTGTHYAISGQHGYLHIPFYERSARKIPQEALEYASLLYQHLGIPEETNKATLQFNLAMGERRRLKLEQLSDIFSIYMFPSIKFICKQENIDVWFFYPKTSTSCLIQYYRLSLKREEETARRKFLTKDDSLWGKLWNHNFHQLEKQQQGLKNNPEGFLTLGKQDLLIEHMHKVFEDLGLEDEFLPPF